MVSFLQLPIPRYWTVAVILLDPRAGSKELLAPMQAAGLPVETEMLPYGDLQLVGQGPDGPLLVGVEYKKMTEIIDCIISNRFAEQLRGLRETFGESWLLLEGNWYPSFNGDLLIEGKPPYTKRRWRYTDVASWLVDVCSKGGVRLWQTRTQHESVLWVKALYQEWSKKWDSRTACEGLYEMPIHGSLRQPSQAMRTAITWPGLGYDKARKVAEKFGTVRLAVNGSIEKWMEVEGMGKTLVTKVQRALDDPK